MEKKIIKHVLSSTIAKVSILVVLIVTEICLSVGVREYALDMVTSHIEWFTPVVMLLMIPFALGSVVYFLYKKNKWGTIYLTTITIWMIVFVCLANVGGCPECAG